MELFLVLWVTVFPLVGLYYLLDALATGTAALIGLARITSKRGKDE